jgi:hypothetical protein
VRCYGNTSSEEERMILAKLKDTRDRRDNYEREMLVHFSSKESEELFFIGGWEADTEDAIGLWSRMAA